jgi:elongator complex protein 2
VVAGCSARIGVMQVQDNFIHYAAYNNLAVHDTASRETILHPAPSPICTISLSENLVFVGCQNGEYLIYKHGIDSIDIISSGKFDSLVSFSCKCKDGFIAATIGGTVYSVRHTTSVKLTVIPSPKKITCIAFVEAYNLLLVALSDLTIVVCEVDVCGSDSPTARPLLTLSDHHVNWVNWMDTTGDRFLTCGQDRNCRIWTIKPLSSGDSAKQPVRVQELVSANRTITLSSSPGHQYTVESEGLLMGHEDMVLSGRFLDKHGKTVVTGSADRTIIKWEEGEEAWQSVLQVGDVTGIGAAGSGDLYDVASTIDGTIMAHNTNGTIVTWPSPEHHPVVLCSGHFDAVTDVVFDIHSADYILSCSADRTTRAWAITGAAGSLVELARPQIHGYELKSLAFIDRVQFVSAGDEKVLRVFNMTDSFATRIQSICTGGASSDYAGCKLQPGAVMQPALGLSNKASGNSNNTLTPADRPVPLESDLSHYTLWPETDKLYGHGDELQCVAASPDHLWLASASRATLAGDSSIRIWSSVDHQTKHILKPHSLTVVRLAFSPSSQYLLSCSRDRKVAVIDVEEGRVEALVGEAHERIIWDGAWISNDQFVTGSRDKTVKWWKWENGAATCLKSVQFEESVTAVSAHSDGTVHVGLESGQVYSISAAGDSRQLVYKANGRINRLARSERLLAIASADHSLALLPV